MNNSINPYRQRGMIREPDDAFFGRARELRDAFTLLKTMQSVSVVGERRIGKSSFLHRLATPRNGELDKSFTLHYLDLQRVFSAQEFYARACKKLDRETGDSHLDLEEAIQNRKVVFCLDEFEQAYEKDFGDEFFNALRSLAQTGNLALVVATQTPLNELHAQFLQDTDVTSKFHNIFTRLNLGEFTPEEARALVTAPRGDHRFSDAETNAILEFGDKHPYRLNLACSIFFDAKQSGLLNNGTVPEQLKKKLRIQFLGELELIGSGAFVPETASHGISGETDELPKPLLPEPQPKLPSILLMARKNLTIRLSVIFSVLTLIFGLSGAGAATPVGVGLLIVLSFFSLVFLVASWIAWPTLEKRSGQ